MAIEKTLNTRLKLRYDSHENWLSADPVLLAGEVALATVATKQEGTVNFVPSVLIKVGDNTHKYSELDFAYAKAADVVAAAKSETALTEFINSVIANSGLATDGVVTALTERVAVNEGAIKTLKGDAETEGSVAKAIKDAIDALNLTETYAAKEHDHAIADVTDLQDALDAKVAKEDGKSLIADTEIARLAGMSDGANKVEASETNGNIKIDGVETVVYTHPAKHDITDIEGLQNALDGKQSAGDYAAENHKHTKEDITDFEHTHIASEITDLDATIKEYGYATKEEAQGYVNTYKTANDQALADEVQARKDADAGLQEAIDAINNETTGILKQAKDYADGKDEAIAAAKKAGDDAMAEAQKKVASVAAGDASVTVAGTATVPTVAVKLDPSADNALKLNENGLKVEIGAAPEYTIVKAADSGDYAAVYNLTKDGTIVGASINIPKDIVVKSGSVIGDEIVLVLNDEAATEIKIPVASLIEYVTSGSAAGDMVVINVSDDHKVTATITDGTITLAKLETDVQTAIGKAHSHENADVLAGITADDVAAWDAAEANAIAKANELNDAMDTRIQAVEDKAHVHKNFDLLETYTQTETDLADAVAKKHDHANAEELAKFVDGDKAKLDTAVQTVTAGVGLTAVKSGTDVAIEIDETVTFIFDCGGAE